MQTFLYVPGHKPQYLGEAFACNPDAVIIDAEDALPEGYENIAADTLTKALQMKQCAKVYLRIPASFDLDFNINTLNKFPIPDGYVLSKAESIGQLNNLRMALRLRQVDECGIELIPLIENPTGVIHAPTIASFPTTKHLFFGAMDYAAATGTYYMQETRLSLMARAWVANAALAYGKTPIDTVLRYKDEERALSFIEKSRSLGYRGCQCAWPKAVSLAKGAYGMTAEEAAIQREVAAKRAATGEPAFLVEGTLHGPMAP